MDAYENRCPSCGMPLQPDDTYCPTCGTKAAPRKVSVSLEKNDSPEATPAPPQAAPAPQAQPVPAQPTAGAAPEAPAVPPPYGQPAPGAPGVPPPGTTPPGYGAPPPQGSQPYGAMPGQGVPPNAPPPGYSTPPPYPPNGGYPPPSYPAYPSYPPMAPQRRGVHPAVLVVIILVCLGILGAAVAFFAYSQDSRPASVPTTPGTTPTEYGYTEEDYQTLMEEICAAYHPNDVTWWEWDLDDFEANAPALVDADLRALMDACVDYIAAPLSEERYSVMQSALRSLTNSDVWEIAECADYLTRVVEQDQVNFTVAMLPDPAMGNTPEETPLLASEVTYGTLGRDNTFGLTLTNNSGKTIVYYEAWVFCYDENGNPIDGNDDTNWEWIWATDETMALAEGESITLPSDAFYFDNCPGTYLAYPYITYVEYADESYEGIFSNAVSPEVEFRIENIQPFFDTWAKEQPDQPAANANTLVMQARREQE